MATASTKAGLVSLPLNCKVLQVWNFDFLNATQGQIYGNASASYETLEANQNNTVYLGVLVQAALNTIRPTNITVNGQQCVIQLVNNITSKSKPLQITPLSQCASKRQISSATQSFGALRLKCTGYIEAMSCSRHAAATFIDMKNLWQEGTMNDKHSAMLAHRLSLQCRLQRFS